MKLETRKEIVIHKNGGPEVLLVREVRPSASFFKLKKDEILIDVYYSGINFADIVMRLGFYPDAPPKPFVPGYEVSGKVVAIGDQVKKVQVGDKVFAGTLFNGHSSLVKSDEKNVFKVPSHLSLAEACALPVAFITSYAAIWHMGRVRPGDDVLIDCATGGVGTIAVQILKKIGANAFGMTSTPSKKSYIESLGAIPLTVDELYDQKKHKGKKLKFDFILNSTGGNHIKKQLQFLKSTGRIVCIGISSGVSSGALRHLKMLKTALCMPRFSLLKLFNDNRGVYALNALTLMKDVKWFEEHLDDFQRIHDMELRPVVGEVFSYADVSKAHRYIEDKKGKGKILLKWKDGE